MMFNRGCVTEPDDSLTVREAVTINPIGEETVRLVTVLRAAAETVDNVASNLLIGRMTSAKQKEYAALLFDLACLTEEHANTSRTEIDD